MRKVEQKRTNTIMKSAELFNQKGYTGTTMQDILEATGLTKGGIYRSFSNKDELAVEAFKYAVEVMWGHFSEAVEGYQKATEKILAIFNVYSDAVHNPPIKGGCPFLNTAVECDHSFPVLRDEALRVYENMSSFIQDILKQGVVDGEFSSNMDTECVASFIFSTMEGSIMVSRLTRDNKHVRYAMNNIEHLLNTSILHKQH